MKLNRILIVVPLLPLLTACYNNKREALNQPVESCATTATTYSGFVQGVIQNACLSCHASVVAAFSGRGVVLEGHANLQPWALNGQLVKVISHAPGAPAMPQGGQKLDDCTIARIQNWVAAGALNN
ncbi:hypothetical protein EPD60_04795 [Flaviaesturariibacter flavus]|uniref:Cytochrome c domain-containing protein n=1 Tax=Flaviaesturariibacter flavus TaxID=2502780 RepID=A0A4V2NWI5_9BACT|nr:hypothetical protein [Flaviaesturariibacter flavus]TCJ17512.1 hypothetical protein EPD60_04795 [Flaviaesturariibacter flavus]